MKPSVLVIDNYDSFVHNIARYLVQLGCYCKVVRNDRVTLDDIKRAQFSHIVISPGPCSPNEAGISLAVVENFYQTLPLLGICLGHQAIGQAFGGSIRRALLPLHGKSVSITHVESGIFKGIDSPMRVGCYHSLIVDEQTLSSDCCVIARSIGGEVMALAHQRFPVYGVQFHPESILTDSGYALLRNFVGIEKSA